MQEGDASTYIMPWGIHKDRPLEKVPLLYLEYINNQPWLREDVKLYIQAYLEIPEVAEKLKKINDRIDEKRRIRMNRTYRRIKGDWGRKL